ncbi:MAG TPA: hypothetical protein VGL66_20005 [Caulobacteraceae bacterium]|jgi:hypothetical protein
MNTFAENLKRSPEVYPHTWDIAQDQVLFVQMSPKDYTDAAFLDQRAINPKAKGQWTPMSNVRAAVTEAKIPERLGFIFHTGHVGSTLISRLIDGTQLFCMREPTPLRVLSQVKAELPTPESLLTPAQYKRELAMFLELWSRTWTPEQMTVVKATSFASETAEDVVSRPGCKGALMLYATPKAYVSGILAGPNSRIEAKVLSPGRLRRLNQRLGTAAFRLATMSEGARIAMGWASEMTALLAGSTAREDKVQWLDFDRFLSAPEPGLEVVLDVFGVKYPPEQITALIKGPIMRQYSKQPEHAYDAKLRREVLEQGASENQRDLAEAMAWLEGAAKEWPEIREAVELAA